MSDDVTIFQNLSSVNYNPTSLISASVSNARIGVLKSWIIPRIPYESAPNHTSPPDTMSGKFAQYSGRRCRVLWTPQFPALNKVFENKSCPVVSGSSDIQWCFSQVKGTLDDDVTEGKPAFGPQF